MIAIIDYDAGNIKSVEKALLYLGEECEVTRDTDKILSADKVIRAEALSAEGSGAIYLRGVQQH